jgi:hypothetical protein
LVKLVYKWWWCGGGVGVAIGVGVGVGVGDEVGSVTVKLVPSVDNDDGVASVAPRELTIVIV